MKLFEKILMASEDVKSYLVSGVNNTDTEIPDGSLVEIGDLVDHDVYTGLKDYNDRDITLAGATPTGMYGIVDYVNVEEVKVGNRIFKVGALTAGLPVPQGGRTRVRMLKLHDEFFLGDDNFNAEIGDKGYAIPAANGEFAPSATAATSGLCLKIEFGTNKITGQINDGMKYFCTVVSI